MTATDQYIHRRDRLVADYRSGDTRFRLAKKGMTNLFRYGGNASRDRSGLAVDDFNHVLHLDPDRASIEVEGMATIETVVAATLQHGLLPRVSPELKHITVGGAIVGIGIESSCFLHGFFHDNVAEAEVLLPSGEIVTCNRHNEHAALFAALPNSFGTLGYVLRARLELMPAQAFVRLENSSYDKLEAYLDAFENQLEQPRGEFLEGMFYSGDEFYLTSGNFIEHCRDPISIYRGAPYYRKVRKAGRVEMRSEDYIFRFDPDWFWNVPEHGLIELFRQFGPRRWRNSSFYTRYTGIKRRIFGLFGIRNRDEEELIQDWVVPWRHAAEFIRFIVDNIDIQGQPWVALPIIPKSSATLYPLEPGQRYMNIGCYCFTRKPDPEQDYYYTRILDELCFRLGGIKMLYSSIFLPEEGFDELYNGDRYRQLKRQYDPENRALTLYQKAAAKL
ncbi:MAG TPA: FAD-binding oxidoreductase [Gammaproteobacteria bacterium]|nr:FAD-binding oxidoreductase [Gammaproteobacteria bacterium]